MLCFAATEAFAETVLQAEKGATGAITVSTAPPAGFDDLLKPNYTRVDVSYGGLPIGAFMATFDDNKIRFDTPDEILAKIPAVRPETREQLKAALTGDIPTHADALCQHVQTQTCGRIAPDIAGVIFDINHYKANIFVNGAYLDQQRAFSQQILPPAEEHFSAVHSINLAAAGEEVTPQDYSLLQNSIYSYGPARLNIRNIVSQDIRRVDTVAASLDRWGLESTAGLFDSRSSILMPQVQMAGVSVATSYNTNLDLRRSSGNDIIMFFPQRSWVSLIYRGVIYSTDLYEAGNQTIDTTALPEGSYEVTVRVRGIDGDTREEKLLFVKHFDIPPPGERIFYAQAGVLTNTDVTASLPSLSQTPTARAGVKFRIMDTTGINADALILDRRAYLQGGLFALLPVHHQLLANMMVSDRGGVGANAAYITTMFDDRLAVSANALKIWPRDRGEARGDILPDPSELMPNQSSQYTGTVSYQLFDDVSAAVQGNYARIAATPARYAYGPQLRWNVWQARENTLMLTMDHAWTDTGRSTSILLSLSIRLGAWGFTSNYNGITSSTVNDGRLSNTGNARVTYNDDRTPGRLMLIGAETSRGDNGDTYGADLDYRSNAGRLKLNGLQTENNNVKRQFFSGALGFNILQTADDFAWGGDREETSGVIVDTDGKATATTMKVNVDGGERTTAKVGSSTPLFLPPYQTYKISLSPATGSKFIDYDGSVHEITLYPGNVSRLHWEIENSYVLLGQVVGEDHQPLVGASVKEARNITVTDEFGNFQAEVLDPRVLTFTIEPKKEQPAGAPPVRSTSVLSDIGAMPVPGGSEKLSAEQSSTILDIFGPLDQASALPSTPAPLPPTSMPAPEPEAENATPPMDEESAPAPEETAPAMVCQVTLPKATDVNNVMIYNDPLVCVPVPAAEEAPQPGTTEEGKALDAQGGRPEAQTP
jgi:hypothetical protein